MADADAAADTASGSADAPAGPRSGEVANGGYFESVSQVSILKARHQTHTIVCLTRSRWRWRSGR